jgi:hypothetical protein
MQAMMRRERQQLHELASLAQAPRGFGDRLAGADRCEPAEQADRDIAGDLRAIVVLVLQPTTSEHLGASDPEPACLKRQCRREADGCTIPT